MPAVTNGNGTGGNGTNGNGTVICSVRDSAVKFSDDIQYHEITPYAEHYACHPSLIVADANAFKRIAAHADRFTGKSAKVMEDRKHKIYESKVQENAMNRRELILRQLHDNDAHMISACTRHPCVTAIIISHCHSSQRMSAAQVINGQTIEHVPLDEQELNHNVDDRVCALQRDNTLARDGDNDLAHRLNHPCRSANGATPSARSNRLGDMVNAGLIGDAIQTSDSQYICPINESDYCSICGRYQLDHVCGCVDKSDASVTDSVDAINKSVASITNSVGTVNYIQSDDMVYNTDYLNAYDFGTYGYERIATQIVDYVLGVRTPPENKIKYKKRQGAKATKKLEQLESVGHELNSREATSFRALAARCNYLAQDRADIAYSAKELCREFAVPNKRSYEKLKRLVRYLAGQPRLVHHYPFQDKQVGINVYVDTDFAGCKATRRSTSGGIAMYGSHAVKHWSKTQTTVCLSSGEAELRGIGDGLAQAIGLQSIAADLGMIWRIDIHTDATAAIGIARRRGMGRIRHLDVTDLWIQEKFNSKLAFLHKVPGADNPADILTKYTDRIILQKMLKIMNLKVMSGRSSVAPAAMGTTANKQ